MNKLIALTALIALSVAPIALAGNRKASGVTVVGSKHDLRATGGGTLLETDQAEVCVSCHTPHQPGIYAVAPLWNQKQSVVASYGIYGPVQSPTMEATPTDIGGLTTTSNLCMSCHDGTVSVASMYNPPNYGNGGVAFAVTADGAAFRATNLALLTGFSATGLLTTSTANMGTSLSNDHPVNFLYSASVADLGIKPAAGLPTWALIGGMVQCSSCHDPHDSLYKPFLNATNVASALCTTCHAK